MDLLFSLPRTCEEINANTLHSLQHTIKTWRPAIEQLVEQFGYRGAEALLSRVRINGRPLSTYFSRFRELLVVVVKIMKGYPEDATGLLQDLIGILCLVGVACRDFSSWLSADDAEESWQQLVKSSNLLVQEVQGTYTRHKETFQRLFDVICNLLPPTSVFFVRLSATLIAKVWPHRHSIAKWIAANWKSLATGAAIVGGVALGGLVAFSLYKLFTRDTHSDSERRRQQ